MCLSRKMGFCRNKKKIPKRKKILLLCKSLELNKKRNKYNMCFIRDSTTTTINYKEKQMWQQLTDKSFLQDYTKVWIGV